MKRILSLLLTVLLFAACVPTPETEAVVQKDQNAMLEKAGGTLSEDNRPLAEQLAVPEGNYTFSTSAVEQRLNIAVDARVTVPDVNRLPIIRVRKARFSRELALKTVEYFLQGETLCDMTKEDQPVFDGEIRPYVNGEYGDGSYYRLEVQNKPTVRAIAEGSHRLVSAWISATDKALYEGDLESLLFLSYEEGKTVNYFERAAAAADTDSESFRMAKAQCDAFFEAMGLSDTYALGYASEVLGTPFYRLYYMHRVDGFDTYISADALDRGDYAYPWGYEMIAFAADRDGVRELHWSNPIEVRDTVQERTALLPFSEIMKRFESAVKVKYAVTTDGFGGETGTMTVQVDDIRLCLMRIREQNGDGITGLLVPAWVFYGSSKLIESDGTESYNLRYGNSSGVPSGLFPVIVLNAIDGSVIDFAEGY